MYFVVSMEIGSAYALQVCLLQIPAMVAFSAWYDPANMGEVAKSFTYVNILLKPCSVAYSSCRRLVFPRWDVIALILSMFLMTYTYIEAKSNYHRGSILILRFVLYVVFLTYFFKTSTTSYLVLLAGFYFAPLTAIDIDQGHSKEISAMVEFPPLTFFQSLRWYLARWW